MRINEFFYDTEGVAEGFQEEDPLELSSDYALYIADAGRHMMTQLTNMSKKIQTDSAAAQNAKRWNLGDFMHQHYKTDDMGAINQVFEEYGVGGFFDQNLYELLANWSLQGSEYVTTWKQYSSDVIKNSTRRPGAQSVHEQSIAKGALTENSNNYSNLYSALKDFLPLAMKELQLKQIPKIRLKHSLNYNGQPSFGSFSNGGIELGVHGRHPVDVCRTLAHELVHYKQGKNNQLDHESGETGSHEENQANSVAGIIMRKFSKQYPQYITK